MVMLLGTGGSSTTVSRSYRKTSQFYDYFWHFLEVFSGNFSSFATFSIFRSLVQMDACIVRYVQP